MDNWKIVSKDGNPEEAGVYNVVLIYDDMAHIPGKNTGSLEDFIPTGKQFAVVESRCFMEAKKYDAWIMKDQPKEGLVWHEECGSYPNERVYAWLPKREAREIDLPEGVEWSED